MNKLKVIFVGIGSIATRHIENLKILSSNKNINIVIDVFRTKNENKLSEKLNDIIHIIYNNFENIPNDYDIIFITNPTHIHYDSIRIFLEKGKHFFIEKPVFDTWNLNIADLKLNNESVYYVACPLRYTKIIQYLKEFVDMSSIYSVQCICSSYLPDWRNNRDYRNSYSAHKDLGGGVSIDLIHEWDYIQYLFGFPNKVFSFIDKLSNLEIDSDDIAVYIAEYEDKIVELHLDYFGKRSMRKIQLIGKDDTIIADFIEGEIRYLNSSRIIKLSEDRNEYQIRELECFLDMLKGLKNNSNTIELACNVLKLAKGEW
jgi:Predicted dehydrogenases and related proteins